MNVARPDALRIVRTIAACLSVMSSRTGSSRTVAAYRVADKLTQHADPMGKPNRPQCQPEHRPPPPHRSDRIPYPKATAPTMSGDRLKRLAPQARSMAR